MNSESYTGEDKKIKVLYIVVNEDITSPLLTRQVIELAETEVALCDGQLDLKIMLFQSITSLLKRSGKFASLKKSLKKSGISLVVVPSFTPWPLPNVGFKKTENGYRPNGIWNRLAANVFKVYAFPFLAVEYVSGRRIFHSRSYPAAYAVFSAKKMLSKLKHVFDPRSDFPEESVTAGRWEYGSKDFSFWKSAEKRILKDADRSACISQVYVEHFQQNAGNFNYIVAPNNVDTDNFIYSQEARHSFREKLGIAEADPLFIYLGGMTSQGWHQPQFYKKFYENVLKEIGNAKILFLVPGYAEKMLEESFSGITGVYVRHPSFEDVPRWLSAGDFGLMFLHKKKIAVGTKIGEYISVGLPIICNANCLGAVDFINRNPQAGCVFNLGLGDLDSKTDDFSEKTIASLETSRKHLRLLAEDRFSNECVARTYVKAYSELS